MPDLPFWSFPAAQEIAEVLEWRTDVLPSQAGEQRIALRPRPREIATFRHRLDALGMARAAELARAGFVGDWHVPLWHLSLQPNTNLAQSAIEILLDTGASDFRSEGLAAVAVDGGEAAPVAIASVQPDRLILAEPLDLQLPSPAQVAGRISAMPIRAAVLTSPIDIARRRQGDGTVSASFLLRDAPEIAPLVLPNYLGRSVQTDPSVLRRPLTASLRRAVEYVDNGFGPAGLAFTAGTATSWTLTPEDIPESAAPDRTSEVLIAVRARREVAGSWLTDREARGYRLTAPFAAGWDRGWGFLWGS